MAGLVVIAIVVFVVWHDWHYRTWPFDGVSSAVTLRCLLFGHVPYAPGEDYPKICCRRCDMTTTQPWPAQYGRKWS